MHAEQHRAVKTGEDKALTSHLRTSGLFHTEILGVRMLENSLRLFIFFFPKILMKSFEFVTATSTKTENNSNTKSSTDFL